jgi:glutaredoxin 3
VTGFELFGTSTCPYTRDMRDWLEARRADFAEYDVEADPEARRRMRAIAGPQRTVPILVEDGRVVQVGWQGRGCVVGE